MIWQDLRKPVKQEQQVIDLRKDAQLIKVLLFWEHALVCWLTKQWARKRRRWFLTETLHLLESSKTLSEVIQKQL